MPANTRIIGTSAEIQDEIDYTGPIYNHKLFKDGRWQPAIVILIRDEDYGIVRASAINIDADNNILFRKSLQSITRK